MIWRELEKINHPTRTGACCTIIMTCLGSNYTPHLPWAPVTHVDRLVFHIVVATLHATPIILEMSTSLPYGAPALVLQASFYSTRV